MIYEKVNFSDSCILHEWPSCILHFARLHGRLRAHLPAVAVGEGRIQNISKTACTATEPLAYFFAVKQRFSVVSHTGMKLPEHLDCMFARQ